MQKIECLSDLENAVNLATSTFKVVDFWWRGQPIEKPLIPSVFRRNDAEAAESGLIQRFIHKAQSRYSPCPSIDDQAGWLFLMGHFGLHTRILDWTESLLIATYFAVNKDVSNSGVIWALNPFLLNESEYDEPVVMSGHSARIRPLVSAAYSKTPANVDKVAAIRPVQNNLRMMLQQSTFTIHGSEKPLEDSPTVDKFLLKFEIPANAKESLLHLLEGLGIRESTIFPELQHLARDLCERSYMKVERTLDDIDNSENGDTGN